jgi:hypothetical protein
VAIAVATAAKAACAGFAPHRQLLGRSGHNSQQPECCSNSPGMRNPSAAGVVVRVLLIPAMLSGLAKALVIVARRDTDPQAEVATEGFLRAEARALGDAAQRNPA